ncbi:MBL fold metallo-hydrolase [Candidatus Bipolaricaulota bacterium]|nr:MBL fold metallo-hydrolase [Candidatus Bipolaricaulota bacterium]
MGLKDRIKKLEVEGGELGVLWLGNSGFALKTGDDQVIYLDPYLSNCARRMYGFKRLYPPPIKESEVQVDYLLITHEHGDHLDQDSVPRIMENNESKLIGPEPVIEKSIELGVAEEKLRRVSPGEELSLSSNGLYVMPADHGDLAPKAVGYILEFGGEKLYMTGDTSYDRKTLRRAFDLEPEIVIPPINGKFNNLDPLRAALVARECNAKIAIPSHFWTFAEHGGDPGKFREYVNLVAPNTKPEILALGKPFLYSDND